MGSDPQNRLLSRAGPGFSRAYFWQPVEKNPRILAAVAVGRGVGLCALEPSLRRVTLQAMQSTRGTLVMYFFTSHGCKMYMHGSRTGSQPNTVPERNQR